MLSKAVQDAWKQRN